MNSIFSNKKILIIIALIFITLIIIVVSYFMNAKKSDKPTETKITPSQVVVPEKAESNSGETSNQGNSDTNNSPQVAAQPPQTNDFYDLIVKQSSATPGSQADTDFGIVDTKQPIPGWYVVTIKKGSIEPAKVIFHQTNDPNNPLAIVAGPGTYFPPESVSIPDAVRKAL